MSLVYVIQEPPKKRGADDEDWEYKYDLSDAEHFGELHYVLSYSEAKKMTIAQLQEAFEQRLGKFTENDYLLMIGSPIVQAAAILAAAPLVNTLPFLVYQRGVITYTEALLDTRHIFWGQGNVAPRRR